MDPFSFVRETDGNKKFIELGSILFNRSVVLVATAKDLSLSHSEVHRETVIEEFLEELLQFPFLLRERDLARVERVGFSAQEIGQNSDLSILLDLSLNDVVGALSHELVEEMSIILSIVDLRFDGFEGRALFASTMTLLPLSVRRLLPSLATAIVRVA
jgi:hypothetical protein